MKIYKALLLSLMLTLSFNTFAEEEAPSPAAAVVGQQDGCGPNSTCSECVNQSTVTPDNGGPAPAADAADGSGARQN